MLARGLGSWMRDEGDFDDKTWLQFFFSCILFSLVRLKWLLLLKQVKPSPDRKVIKLLTSDNLLMLLRHSP